MRNFTFKGLFLTAVFMLLGCFSIQAANDDLITKQITIKLDEAGTLPDKIGSSRMYKITNLKIVGKIDGTDWDMIRMMAGRDYHGDVTKGNLSVLDLSEAKIVNGGGYYYYYDYDGWSYIYGTYYDKIGDYAFKGCSGLTSLTLPATITTIGKYAFEDCTGLTSLNLPAGITSIGRRAFGGCSGLTSLTLPAGITSISDEAFYLCSGLTSLTLPAGITSIGSAAFCGCSGLTSLALPAGITEIGGSAFFACSGLTSLTLPAGITEIGYQAFSYCSGLTSLTLPAGITSISDNAFYGCSGLTSLTLPAGITLIGESAFCGCSGLTSLTLPAGITEIGSSAFSYCSGLTSIYVYSEKVPKIGSDVFYYVDKKKCTVYVPKGTYADYRSSNFGYFENIVEFDATGIDKTTTSTDVEEVSRYSVNGQRLAVPVKGFNIVKYSDGSARKVVVK